MALTSPGVEVTIIDQSQYLPAPTNSVPLVVLATAQNKANASGTGVAAATTAANANKLFQVTSQRDLVDLYGTPFFYTTTNGTPIQGYELNEYGLLAAYSLLGVTNRCYVLRADIDLASLVGQTSRPVGAPANGTYWLDTTTSTWGIYEFNTSTGQFVVQDPIVITNSTDLEFGVPKSTIGSIGNYAVNAIQITGNPASAATFFYKTSGNVWVAIGSFPWYQSIPTVIGSISNPTISVDGSFDITLGTVFNGTAQDSFSVNVSVTAGQTITDVANTIDGLAISGIGTGTATGKLEIFSAQSLFTSAENAYVKFQTVSGDPLADLGITENNNYYQPVVSYGTSAQMPVWTAGQLVDGDFGRPTGSVWIKVGSSGNGLRPILNKYSTATDTWINQPVALALTDWNIGSELDPTGGQAIPAGTVYGQYNYNDPDTFSPGFVMYERLATGPTIVTSSDTPNFAGFDLENYYLKVSVSQPGSSTLLTYNITLTNSAFSSGDLTAQDFVNGWLDANIPLIQISLTADGLIQIVHTQGGEIVISDSVNSSFQYLNYRLSSGVLTAAGFVAGTTTSTKSGPFNTQVFASVATTALSGSGSGARLTIESNNGVFDITQGIVATQGTGYAVGDTIQVAGSLIGGVDGINDLEVKVMDTNAGAITQVELLNPEVADVSTSVQLSNWVSFTYISNEGAPSIAPTNNTNWYYSVIDEVDIMVNYGGQWNGYRNYAYDQNGFPLPNGTNATDPNGPIVAASAPTVQSDGTALVYGDIWVDTSDLEMYPVINRWQQVDGVNQWVLIDNSNGTGSNGIIFADARWSSNQNSISPVDDPIPTIKSLLGSDNVDLDAPSSSLYPSGILLFNTRRSGYNVKQYRTNYFTSANFPGQSTPTFTMTWVSVSGLQSNGAPYMGRQAQRSMVVKSLRSAIDTNTDIRDEDNYFNLMATPNYPELQPNMVVLNADRGETGYIIGDTPLGLADSATDIQAWATNAAGATSTGEEGLVTRNTYLGIFYPSGITNDLSGNEVVVPASHMMLRTFLRNDTIAYPWLAAAGTRRGNIDNALNIGYLNRATGEFQTIKTRIGIRDVLYINQINPLVFFTGVGLLNYGNKNSFNSQSALDRTNVARLINYVRRQLTIAARPFVFEPNDSLTRQQIAGVIQTLFVDLVAKRGIYDYLVVCDESNNTPARIDRNELWVDVAIEPVKAAEFIYIPVRVLNTGEIAALG